MNQTDEHMFWNKVSASVGDQYRPHSADYGVFLFREKLRRHDFHSDEAFKLDPSLLAKAIPWATFLTLGTSTYLMLRRYGWPVTAFCCFDKDFHLHLGRVVHQDQDVEEAVLLTSVSVARFMHIENGDIDMYNAFRHAESGHIFRFETPAALPGRCDVKT
jgi:hypothetical protein